MRGPAGVPDEGAQKSSYDFLVKRDELSECRLVSVPTPAIGPGETLLRVDRFALTANNITYGVTGDFIGYWQFFPAQGEWGHIPVWGIATALDSNSEGIVKGDRYYGYFPMAGHLAVTPGHARPQGFVDQSAHRQNLPPVYNQYARMTEALGFHPRHDNHQMIYRPLFTTSFVLDDYLGENDCFGAGQIILSSASSKTAFGTAFMMRDRSQKIVGLTSQANRAFVERLGLYNQVVTYGEVAALDASVPAAYIDMSGNRSVLAAVHHHFGERMAVSCSVGITHHEAREGEDPKSLPGARPKLFFAPSQIQKRNKEWGPAVYQQRLGAAWQAFLGVVDDWVDIVELPTPGRLEEVYATVLNGPAPDKAYVLSY
jgi:hypothetical protein